MRRLSFSFARAAAAAAILYLGAPDTATAAPKSAHKEKADKFAPPNETPAERADRFARWRKRQADKKMAERAPKTTEKSKVAGRADRTERSKASEATELPAPTSAIASAAPPSRGPTRIDFDDRLIQGQTNRSGAVYLYDRKELKNRSMLKPRDSFRDEIVGAVYDN